MRLISPHTVFPYLAFVFLAVALSILWSLMIVSNNVADPSKLVIPVGITTVIIIWSPAIIARSRHRVDVFEGIYLQAIGYTLFFVVPFIYISMNPNWDQMGLVAYYPKTLVIVALGFGSMSIGYYLPALTHLRRFRFLFAKLLFIPSPNNGRIPGYIWGILIIGWSSRAILFATGSYFHSARSVFQSASAWYSPLEQLAILCKIGLIYALIAQFRSQRTKLSLQTWLILIAELVWALPSGLRENVLTLVMFMIVTFWYYRRRLPRVFIMLMVIVLPLFMASTHLYRNRVMEAYLTSQPIDSTQIAESWQGSFAELFSGDKGLDETVGIVMSRLADGNVLAKMISYDPPPLYGRTYVEGLSVACLFWLPRFIWPSKPSSSVIIDEFMGTFFPEVSSGTSPLTMLGEHYWNFRIAGVLIGMFIWGIILRSVYVLCSPLETDNNMAGHLLYIGVSAQLAVPTAMIAGYIGLLARLLLYLFIISFIASHIGKRRL